MSLSVAKANLMDALKTLRQRWDKARSVWNDEAARQFEKDYFDGLEARVVAAIKGLDHVSELTAAVRRDCGDEGTD
jgi:hypothetical protein